jgi:hypothetical protein
MRRTKTIKINDQEITIKELTLKKLANAQRALSGEDESIEKLVQVGEELLTEAAPGINMKQIMQMAPSEIRELIDGFKEVNQTLIDTLDGLGLTEVFAEMKQALINDLIRTQKGG